MSSFDDGTSKCKGVSAESSLLELCRATQHFDDGTSKCKGVSAEHQAGLSYAERRSGNLSYLRNLRAIGPVITHCHQQKFFTPLQAHGMEKITAWRSRKIFLATQKNTAITDKQARSNKILQNKQK